jgi:hypothetical protein
MQSPLIALLAGPKVLVSPRHSFSCRRVSGKASLGGGPLGQWTMRFLPMVERFTCREDGNTAAGNRGRGNMGMGISTGAAPECPEGNYVQEAALTSAEPSPP